MRKAIKGFWRYLRESRCWQQQPFRKTATHLIIAHFSSEFGAIEPEWSQINQAALAGYICGQLYGGFQKIKENTKKGVIGGVVKNGFKYGFGVALLTASYV